MSAQRASPPACGREQPTSLVFRALVRQFLRQFASFETVSTGGEIKEALIAILSLLAGPGLLVSMFAIRGGPRLALQHQADGLPPLLWYWHEEWLLLVMSFLATGILVALQWRSLVLGPRDYRILGVLPLPRRLVLRARLASLLIVVLALHVAVNILAGLTLPMVSPVGYFRTAAALQLTLLLQTVFVCASILALQSLVALVVPASLAERASAAMQALVLLGVAVVFASQDLLAALALEMRDTPHPVNALLPLAWFMSLYKLLLGAESPQLTANASLGLFATFAALAAAVPLALLGYRDREGRQPRLARIALALSSALDGVFAFRHPRQPVARAVSAFVGQTLARSATAALIARGWSVLGVAMTLTLTGGALLAGRLSGGSPPPAALAPVFVLPFFALVGLRVSAAYPAVLEANWVFRVTESATGEHIIRGVRWAAVRRIVLPLLGAAFVPYALVFGPELALAILVWALAVALVTFEWLFFGFPKIPFTCSYLPGKASMRTRWPHAIAIALVYCGMLPNVVSRILVRPTPWLVGLVLLAIVWITLRSLHALEKSRTHGLVFDDRPVPIVTQLGLGD